MTTSANLKHAQLHFERRLVLDPDGKTVRITETVQNQSAFDRPIAWTQHVTLGPPFLKKGSTQFRAPGTKSKVYDAEFGDGKLKEGADFDWPMAPRMDGTRQDLRVYTDAPASSAYTTHLMDPHRDEAFFLAFSPETKVVFGYRWNRLDFPWLGMWEENMSRKQAPWAGKNYYAGAGIRSVSDAGGAAKNDRAGEPVWRAGLPLASGKGPGCDAVFSVHRDGGKYSGRGLSSFGSPGERCSLNVGRHLPSTIDNQEQTEFRISGIAPPIRSNSAVDWLRFPSYFWRIG
jgi:hypothetical protein